MFKNKNVRIGIFGVGAFVLLCIGLNFLKGRDLFFTGDKFYAYYKDINDFETAIKYYKKAWELDQSFTMVLRALASCYEEVNDYESALKTWQETKNWLETHGYTIEANSIEKDIKRCKK